MQDRTEGWSDSRGGPSLPTTSANWPRSSAFCQLSASRQKRSVKNHRWVRSERIDDMILLAMERRGGRVGVHAKSAIRTLTTSALILCYVTRYLSVFMITGTTRRYAITGDPIA